MNNSSVNQEAKGFLEPDRVVQSFGLKAGDHVADFGAGHGYFTVSMSRIVGSDGKVYAIDVQKPVLEIVRAKAKVEHLLNIDFIWANLEETQGSKLKDLFLDFVVVANILFQADAKIAVFQEAHRILRESGKLAVIEWDASPTPLGPPLTIRIAKEDAKALALQAGFTFEKEISAGEHHYGLLFIK